jgi:ferric-dicitrate binding protein FerR (iron transport regulator)
LSYVDSGTSRLVELRGAAYFDVIHRAETFRVLAAGVVTEDLGTQFVIEAYPGTSTAHVAVESGRVAVRSTASQTPSRMVLGAGTGASVDSLGHLSPIDATEVADLLDWTHGELRLDNAPLRDVAAAVSRWYDIDVQVAGAALERQRLTMTIGIDPVAKTLATIADVTHARIEWHGRSVVLKPN